MSDELACAFMGHWHRADICERRATSFFCTARGTFWPLCPACNERHKQVAGALAKSGRVAPTIIAKAVFDIPIDEDSLHAYSVQDPSKISSTFDQADTTLFATLTEPEPV